MSNRMRVVKASDERLEFDNGLVIKDVHGIPKWVQARSEQNGYYSSDVDLIIRDKNCEIIPKDPKSGEFAELFEGEC